MPRTRPPAAAELLPLERPRAIRLILRQHRQHKRVAVRVAVEAEPAEDHHADAGDEGCGVEGTSGGALACDLGQNPAPLLCVPASKFGKSVVVALCDLRDDGLVGMGGWSVPVPARGPDL